MKKTKLEPLQDPTGSRQFENGYLYLFREFAKMQAAHKILIAKIRDMKKAYEGNSIDDDLLKG